jgi:hypothetical protein
VAPLLTRPKRVANRIGAHWVGGRVARGAPGLAPLHVGCAAEPPPPHRPPPGQLRRSTGGGGGGQGGEINNISSKTARTHSSIGISIKSEPHIKFLRCIETHGPRRYGASNKEHPTGIAPPRTQLPTQRRPAVAGGRVGPKSARGWAFELFYLA